MIAAFLGPGERQAFSQRVQQGDPRLDKERAVHSDDLQPDQHELARLFVIAIVKAGQVIMENPATP
jgi:hypothetical protein